jgi:hypothetical protein
MPGTDKRAINAWPISRCFGAIVVEKTGRIARGRKTRRRKTTAAEACGVDQRRPALAGKKTGAKRNTGLS